MSNPPRCYCVTMIDVRHSVFLVLCGAGMFAALPCLASTTNFMVRGVVNGIKPDDHQLVIAHEAIPNFMDAMTMPFPVKDTAILSNVTVGARIIFQLHVNENDTWVDHVEPDLSQPHASSASAAKETRSSGTKTNSTSSNNALRTFKFTNERGQPVSLSDFRGQAIALTFFFTRCPVAEYCPRLSRNFQEVQRRLASMENAPTNWHLLSLSFDP